MSMLQIGLPMLTAAKLKFKKPLSKQECKTEHANTSVLKQKEEDIIDALKASIPDEYELLQDEVGLPPHKLNL